MAEVKKQKAEAPKKAPAKKAEVKQEPAAKPEKKCENTMVKEIFGSKNTMFMLNVVDIVLAATYFIAFLVTSVILLATGGDTNWFRLACQVAVVLFFIILFISNYYCLKPSYNYKNIMKSCLFELIAEVVIIALAIIGFKSSFVVIAILPQLLISAIEIWIAYASSKKE